MTDTLIDNLQRLREAVFARFGQPDETQIETNSTPLSSQAALAPMPESWLQADDDQPIIIPVPTELVATMAAEGQGALPDAPATAAPSAPFPNLRADITTAEPAGTAGPAGFFNRSTESVVPAPPAMRPSDRDQPPPAGRTRGRKDEEEERRGLFRRLLRLIGF